MSSITINDSMPSAMVPPSLASGTRMVVQKQIQEYPAQGNVDFSYSGSRKMTFNISSVSDFISLSESYLRFDLTTAGYKSAGTNDTLRSLNTGGAHALIRTMEITTANNTPIERIDRYNKYYALHSYISETPSQIEHNGWTHGDSLLAVPSPNVFCPNIEQVWTKLSGTVVIAATTNVTSAEVDIIEEEWKKDMIVKVSRVNNTDFISKVTNITYTNEEGKDPEIDFITFEDVSSVETGAGGGEVWRLVTTAVGVQNPARITACSPLNDANPTISVEHKDNYSVNLQLKPMMGLFNIMEYFPLFLIQGGLILNVELEDPAIAMSIASENINGIEIIADNDMALNYNIHNPVFVATMYQPDKEISDMYVKMYRDSELNYSFMSANHNLFQDQGQSGNIRFNVNNSVRSLKHLLIGIQDKRANTTNVINLETPDDGIQNSHPSYNPLQYNSTGSWKRAGLSSYQGQLGSETFPKRRIQFDKDRYGGEVYSQLFLTKGLFGQSILEPRFCPLDWHAVNSVEGYVGGDFDSHVFMVGIDTSRDSSLHSGLDSSLTPFVLDFEFEREHKLAKILEPRYYHVFSVYDVIMSISSQGTIIRK